MADFVNTDMYTNRPQVQIPNMLGMAQTFANTQGQFQENEMRRRTIAARQAFGQILQSTIGPDGTPDYEKAAVLMSANPATAWAAPEFIQQMATTKGLNIDNLHKKLELAFRQQDAIAQTLAPLTAEGANITPDKVKAAAAQLYNSGLLGTGPDAVKMYSSAMSSMPTDGPALSQWLLNFAQRSKQTSETLGRTIGQVTGVNYGGGEVLGAASTLGGFKPLAQIQFGPTPGEYYRAQEKQYPGGDVKVAPAGERFGMPGATQPPGTVTDLRAGGGGAAAQGTPEMGMVGGAATGTPVGGGASVAPPNGAAAGGGGPSAGMTENPALTPGSAANVAQGGAPAGHEITTNLGSNVNAQQQDFAKATADLNETVSRERATVASIQQVKNALGKATAGGGADLRSAAGTILQALGLPPNIYNAVANGDLAASQEAKKYLTSLSISQGRQLLGGSNKVTNFDVNLFLKSLPMLDTDPNAIEHMLNFMNKVAAMDMAEQSARAHWTKMAQDPEWAAKFGGPEQFDAAWNKKMQELGWGKPIWNSTGSMKGTAEGQ